MPGSLALVADNIDTLILNVKLRQDFPLELAQQLDVLKEASQDAEEDFVTDFVFAGERLFIKPHGAGKQWRWILHSPSFHLDVGLGKQTQIVAKARLSAAYLWATEIGDALTRVYAFLTGLLGSEPFLQVSEAHLCVDVVGWELAVGDAAAFVTRGHRRGLRLEDEDETPPALQINLNGRRCGTLDFSKGAAHSCCIYDKTKEITVSRKDWMHEVWRSNGWDGESRVTRVEFRYKRECLREMGVEEAFAFLDQLPSLWAYSTKQWLRHTLPTTDHNKARWPTSPLWEQVQQATFFGDGVPAVRERKTAGDLLLICQMLAGCSTTASALLTNALPLQDDGTHFLIWFMTWLETYLEQKGISYEDITEAKRLKLGVVTQDMAA
jgi:hypothetical protein